MNYSLYVVPMYWNYIRFLYFNFEKSATTAMMISHIGKTQNSRRSRKTIRIIAFYYKKL